MKINETIIPSLKNLEIAPWAIQEPTRGGAVTKVVKKEVVRECKIRFLEVTGVIFPVDEAAPKIEWRILLPYDWNRRSVQIGGGANNGYIPDLEHGTVLSDYCPIEHGYVIFADDSGHQSADPMSADFASNQESLMNYIRQHLIKTCDVMHAVVKLCYGVDAEKVYFSGGSAGGREALECATTYGKYYDGVFCASPASNFVLLRMWGALLSKAVYDSYNAESYPFSDGFIDEETVAAIRADAIEMYDALDGIQDGIISNIFAARAKQDAFRSQIQEKYCLTEAQMKTIDIYENGFRLDYAMPNGMRRYRGCSALEGGLMDLGPDPIPREPLDTKYNVHHGDRSDGVFKYFIAKDKNWKLIDHDYAHPDERLMQMLMEASKEYDVNDPNFDDFIAHGGKLILFTCWNDMSISPWQIVDQYLGYVQKYGKERTDSFVKFYTMPSAGHCQGITMDYLKWLDVWCTTGEYPSETLYGTIEKTGGQMPMAEFPGWVKYIGGDPLSGTSYEVSYDRPQDGADVWREPER